MATKLKDIVSVAGEYQSGGETKKRYKTIGAVWQGDNGQYITLDRTVNLAAFPFKEGSDSIIASLYDPKGKDEAQPAKAKEVEAPAFVPDDMPF